MDIWAISSEAPKVNKTMENVQRPTPYQGVGDSVSEMGSILPGYAEDEDMVCSAWKHAAARNGAR